VILLQSPFKACVDNAISKAGNPTTTTKRLADLVVNQFILLLSILTLLI